MNQVQLSAEKSRPARYLKWFGVFSSVGMFIINFIGFLDTQTNSAEGCGPDWPLCNGQILPSLNNIHVIIELMHRFLVGFFAVVAVVFVVWALMKFRRFREVRIFAWFAIGFIVVQSLLGALAVVFVNPPEVLALHLGFGLIAMGAVALLTVFLFQYDHYAAKEVSGLNYRTQSLPKSLIHLIRWTWVYMYADIYLGSDVAFHNAGTACTGWPLCNGEIFPGLLGNVGLAFAHRLAAIGFAVLSIWLMISLNGVKKERPDLYKGAQALFVMILLQIFSGAWVILSNISLNADLLHVSLLMVLFTVLSYLFLQTYPFREAPVKNSSEREKQTLLHSYK